MHAATPANIYSRRRLSCCKGYNDIYKVSNIHAADCLISFDPSVTVAKMDTRKSVLITG
jgi:hypothetical protein